VPAGKIDLYGLGTGGVNVVKSPLHLDDQELTKAQNAYPDRTSGEGGLKKRDGLIAHTGTGLGGAITGIANVPLALPSVRTLHVAALNSPVDFFNVALPAFAATANNTVLPEPQDWTTSTGGVFAGGFQSQNQVVPLIQPALSHDGIFYYPLDDRRGVLIGYDGQQYYDVCRLPACGAIGPIFLHNGLIYVGARGSGGFNNYVYQINQETGTARLLAITTPFTAGTEEQASGCSYLGKLWLGTSRASQGRIHSGYPDDTAWVVERTAAAGLHTYTSLAMYKGKLYAATAADAGTAAIIEERTVAGVWSTVRTGGASAEANYFDGLHVFDGNLYAIYTSASQFNGGFGDDTYTSEIHKFDGTTWSTDLDLSLTDNVVPLGKVVTNNCLYYATMRNPGSSSPYTSGRLIQRTTAGAYTQLTLGAGGMQTHTLGFTGERGA
jgi:hypothetical protein